MDTLAPKRLGSETDPLYIWILNDLTARIRVGGNLRTEVQFCRDYQASWRTVREALRRLVDDGMVVRRQKAGTTVVAAQAPAS